MINLDNFKPDWSQATLHGTANQVGKKKQASTHDLEQSNLVCKCCGQQIYSIPLSLCDNTKQLEQLGVGFPLYFVFVKYIIFFFLLQSMISSIFGILWSNQSNQNFCVNFINKVIPNTSQEVECTSIFIQISRIEDYVTNDEITLRIISFLSHLLFLIYLRDSLIKLNEYYDERSTTYSDYSLIIKQLPHKISIKKDLSQILSPYKIIDIILLGDLEKLSLIELEKYKKLSQKKYVMENIKQFEKSEVELLDLEVKSILTRIEQTIAEQRIKYKEDKVYAFWAIAIINTDEQKQQIIQNFKSSHNSLSIEGWQNINIQFEEAPEPKEICWENIHISESKKYRLRIIGWTLFLLVLALITGIFYLILRKLTETISSQLKTAQNTKIAFIGAYTSFISIQFFNKFVLTWITNRICIYQKFSTKTDEQFDYMLKYLLGQFFTTAIMTLLVEDFTQNNIYRHNFGVIETQSYMILITSILVPIIWLINPQYIIVWIKRKYSYGTEKITQREANNLMQHPTYQIGKRYAQIIKLIWLVCLYQSLIPLGYPLALFGLICYYWVDKYNLYRKSSVKFKVSGFLTQKVMKLMDVSLILSTMGEIIFDWQIRYNYSLYSFITFSIAVIYCLLPMSSILQKIHPEHFRKQEKTFLEVKQQLGKGYAQLHPILGDNCIDGNVQLQYEYFTKLFMEKHLENTSRLNETVINLSNLQLNKQTRQIHSQLKILKTIRNITDKTHLNANLILQDQQITQYVSL